MLSGCSWSDLSTLLDSQLEKEVKMLVLQCLKVHEEEGRALRADTSGN